MTVSSPSSPHIQSQGEQASSKSRKPILQRHDEKQAFRKAFFEKTKLLSEIKDLNKIWINELLNDNPEKATRLEVARIIEECFTTKNPHLVLEKKGLTSLPDSLKHLQHITYLDLESNNITTLPDSLSLPNLEVLSLNNNNITTFPKALSFPHLNDFHATDNKLEIFPEFLLSSPHLKTLILLNNSIKMLPDTICDLKNLEAISMSGNNLEKLPENFSNLSKLWVIDFGSNRLAELPEKFLFPNLKILYIGNNHIKEFPKYLCQSQDLEELDFRGSPFRKLPEEFSFPKLKKLYIHSTDLKELPPRLSDSKDLEYLNASMNDITDYPENFIFPKLKNFKLNQTKITKFPENILQSTELEELHLNNIPNLEPKTLPEGFEKLIHLKELWLGNTITNYFHIPRNIREIVGIDIDIKPNTQNIQGSQSVHTPVVENAKEQNLKNAVTYLPVTEDEAGEIIKELTDTLEKKLENSQTPDFLPSHENYDIKTLEISHEQLTHNQGYIIYYKKEGKIIGATLNKVKEEVTNIINDMIKGDLDETQYTFGVVTNIKKAFKELLTEQNKENIAGLLDSFTSDDNTPSHKVTKKILDKLCQDSPEDIYDKSEYFVPTQTQKLKTALNVLTGENSHFHSPTKIEVKDEKITIKQLFAGTVKFIEDLNTVWDDGIKDEDKEKIIYDKISDTLYQIGRDGNLIPSDNYISLDNKEPDSPRCFGGATILLSTMYHSFIKIETSLAPLPSPADYSDSFLRTTEYILRDVFNNNHTNHLNYNDIINNQGKENITSELWGHANSDGTGTGIAPLVRTALRENYNRLRFLCKQKDSDYIMNYMSICTIKDDKKLPEEILAFKKEIELWNALSNNYQYVDITDIPLSDSLRKGKRIREDSPKASEKRTKIFRPLGESSSPQIAQPPL